jgi:hypothetical protein
MHDKGLDVDLHTVTVFHRIGSLELEKVLNLYTVSPLNVNKYPDLTAIGLKHISVFKSIS